MDKVFTNHTPLFVTRSNGEDVVGLSKADYESMQETFHLLKSPNNAARLLMGIEEYEKGARPGKKAYGRRRAVPMKIVFLSPAWEDYLFWQKTDKSILRKINSLIKEIERTPLEGAGKPEPLKHSLAGWWS